MVWNWSPQIILFHPATKMSVAIHPTVLHDGLVMGQSRQNGEGQEKMVRFRRLTDALPEDVVQCRLSLPTSELARIHAIKQRFHIRTRDAAIAAMIRAARTYFTLEDFDLPAEPDPDDAMVSISLSLEAGHVAFLYRLQRRYRGCSLGATLEAVIDTVRDLAPRPVQLNFFKPPLVGG